MNVNILRTPMGDVIGDMEKKEDVFLMKKAFALNMAQTNDGVSVDFTGLAPFADGVDPAKPYMTVEISAYNVMFPYKPSESLLNGYLEAIGEKKIMTPENKIIMPS